MTDEQYHADDLVAAYVLGAVTPDEAALVERHLETCEQCRGLERELREVEELLPHLTAAVEPSPALKERLLAAVAAEPPAAPAPRTTGAADPDGLLPPAALNATAPAGAEPLSFRRRARRPSARLYPWLAVAAALVLIAAGIATWRLAGTGASQRPVQYAMAGTSAMRSINGHLFYYKDGKRLRIVLSGLKPVAAGRVYEVWLVTTHGNTIVGATGIGVFRPRPDGRVQTTLSGYNVEAYNVIGLTVERAPRSAVPHFPIVAEAKIA